MKHWKFLLFVASLLTLQFAFNVWVEKPEPYPNQEEYLQSVIKLPATSCHLAGGTWQVRSIDTQFGGDSTTTYSCSITHPWQQDWTLKSE